MRIEGLKKYRDRNPSGYFEDLPWEARQRAFGWLHQFCQRWRGNLPSWRFAILVGQAKRLARTTPEERSQWGRKMWAKLGGHTVQRVYREQGRTGNQHPAHKAARISALRRKQSKKQRGGANLRDTLDMPITRSKWLDPSC
jgi:hypothetical protein